MAEPVVTHDKARPRKGWEKMLVDIGDREKWRWVYADPDADADEQEFQYVKHSSIKTHFAVGEVSEGSSSSATSSASDRPKKKPRRQLAIERAAATPKTSPTSKVHAHRFADGLFAQCKACDNKKRLKVVNCPCEESRRAALVALVARKKVDAEDATHKKFYTEVAADVAEFDKPSSSAKEDSESDGEQVSIKVRCPRCSEMLYVCTKTPFKPDECPYTKKKKSSDSS